MAASIEQKVDFLLKKLGYTATKTGIAEDSSLSGTLKAPFAEAIASPLVVPNTSIWQESGLIDTTPPATDTAQVKGYRVANAFQMTMDSTVSGNRTFLAREAAGNNSSAMVGDWIDTQFGADYIINVYKGDPNAGGVKLSASGSGSNDTWFFDYSAGVLNFNGDSVPAGVGTTNIYIVGYRYVGAKGVSQASVTNHLAALQSDINLITEKIISIDERCDIVDGLPTLVLALEDNTPTTAATDDPIFVDNIADGSTTTFTVTLDSERGVYALDGVPQPTVQVPRGDIIVFDVSGLPIPSHFRIYDGDTELSVGVVYAADSVTLSTSQIAINTSRLNYRNSLTSGLGWIIEVVN